MSTHIVSYTLLLLTVIFILRAVHRFSVNEDLYTQKPLSNENFNLVALRPCQKILPGQMDHTLIQSGNSMGCHAVKWLGGQLRKFYLMHEESNYYSLLSATNACCITGKWRTRPIIHRV